MSSIDAVDLKILQLLEQDGLRTNKEIAAVLNLTTTPVHERIKRLKRDGYIERYTIDVNRKKLDKNLMVMMHVSLKEHAQEYLNKFEDDVQSLPEVIECFVISGNADFLLKVVVKDMEEYKSFVMNKIAALSNIGNTQSSFVINEIKKSGLVHIKSKPNEII